MDAAQFISRHNELPLDDEVLVKDRQAFLTLRHRAGNHGGFMIPPFSRRGGGCKAARRML